MGIINKTTNFKILFYHQLENNKLTSMYQLLTNIIISKYFIIIY